MGAGRVGVATVPVGLDVGLGVPVGVRLGVAVADGVALGVRLGVDVGVELGVVLGVAGEPPVAVGVALDCGDPNVGVIVVSGVGVSSRARVAVESVGAGVWLCSALRVEVAGGGSSPVDRGRRTRNPRTSTTPAAATAATSIHRDREILDTLLPTDQTGGAPGGWWPVAVWYRGQAVQPSAKQAAACWEPSIRTRRGSV